jgi:DNA-binding NarL/FixJ family response regulator
MTKIGIVEDSKTTREGLATIIDLSPDYRCVCVCDTAEKALVQLPKHAPEVVLMDIQLPGMSGIECVRRLREALPDVLIVMVTVYEDPVRIFSALRAGANGYLLKRSTPEEMITAIREVRRGGGAMSGGVAMKVIQYFSEQEQQTQELDSLSRRESEVLELLSSGMGNKEIADRLGVSTEAVRWHLRSIYSKLHVHNRTEAAMKFRGNL